MLFIIFLTNLLFGLQKSIYLSFSNCDVLEKENILKEVREVLNVDTKIISTLKDFEFAYNKARKQYLASAILRSLKSYVPPDGKVLVLVVDVDLYEEGFNYIFGQSCGNVCIVSIYRFKPCTRIDSQQEKETLAARTAKTIIHEVGHSLGLPHCKDNRCVMYFSNWVGDTDRKTKYFCKNCKEKLGN
jgi:archaemetzincin